MSARKQEQDRRLHPLTTRNYHIKSPEIRDGTKTESVDNVPKKKQTIKDLLKDTKIKRPLESYGYQKLFLIAEGGYGSVYKGWDERNQRPVALKYMNHADDGSFSQATLREVSLLKSVNGHPNIVNMIEWIMLPLSTVMVLDFMDSDLSTFIKKFRSERTQINSKTVRSIMKGILTGTDHLHKHAISHRDLKPRNILVSPPALEPKIADFGLSKFVTESRAQVENFGTRWYRAPEVLLALEITNNRVDMWSIGTIFAELKECVPMFPGRDNEDQIRLIVAAMGIPTRATWPQAYQRFTEGLLGGTFPETDSLAEKCPSMTIDDLAILRRFLQFEPCRRWSADEALKHSYFNPMDFEDSSSQRKPSALVPSLSGLKMQFEKR